MLKLYKQLRSKTLATAVYNNEEIELADGTKLHLRAMTIKNRRKFMKAFDALANAEQTDDRTSEDNENDLLKLVPLCVAGQRPEWEDANSDDPEKVEAALDALAEALDEETLYYVIKQTAGIDLKAMAEVATEMLKKGTLDGMS